MLGSGSHCRMLVMVGVASTAWLAEIVVDAGKLCTATLFTL